MLGMHATNAAGELRRYAIPAKRIGVSAEEYAQHVQQGDGWCSYNKHWQLLGAFGVTSLGRKDSYCLACRELLKSQRNGTTTRIV